ncbi:hypothetical protein Goshw_007851, partial [Gossypium schwendimanii]|nr:hypothetical protein [Gossypium schwendimanii]
MPHLIMSFLIAVTITVLLLATFPFLVATSILLLALLPHLPELFPF